MDNLESEVDDLRRQNEDLKAKLNEALLTGGGSSMELREEFAELCKAHRSSIGLNIKDSSQISDETGIIILQGVSKALLASSAGDGTGAPASSRGASRMGTAQSHKTESDSELRQQIHSLQQELRLALGAAEDIRLLKSKLLSSVDRNRIDKEKTLKSTEDMQFMKKKMDMLTDHLEKLMTHLKHEAASKVRAQEALRVQERELVKGRHEALIIRQKSAAKDRLVLELREGSKILEDQLRLMDEKYLELRVKLDWARENGEKKVRQAQAAAKDLRIKFAMMGGGSLDKLSLPSLSVADSRVGYDESSILMEPLGSQQLGGGLDEGSMSSSVRSSAPGKKKKKKGGGMGDSQVSSQSWKEPNLDHVMEKIKKHQGGKREWGEDEIRNLAKSR